MNNHETPLYGTEPSYSPRFPQLPTIPPALAEVAFKRKLKKGEKITRPGEYCYYIVSGIVAAHALSGTGDEYLTFLLEPQNMFLESNIVGGAHLAKTDLDISFIAEDDVELLEIYKDDLLYLIHSNSEVSDYLMISIAQKMHAFYFLYYEEHCHDAAWQVANLLMAFAERYERGIDGTIEIDYPVSQQMVADMLGISRMTVSKCFKKMKDRNLIMKVNNHYVIPNPRGFRDYLKSFK